MSVQSIFPISLMGVGGLFLSGLFPYLPLSTLLLLGLFTAILLLHLSAPHLPALILHASFICGLLLSWHSSVNPIQSGSRPLSFCIDAQPHNTKGGLMLEGRRVDTSPFSASIRLFLPTDRLPMIPVVLGDCFSGTATGVSENRPGPVLFRDRSPLYILRPSDAAVFIPGTDLNARLFRWSATLGALLSDEVVQTFSPRTAGLLSALLLSDTRRMPTKDQEEFRQAGVSHLLSVSGEHMTLLALFLGGLFLFLLRLLPLSWHRHLSVLLPVRRVILALTLPVLGIYTLIIGLPPAAVRAYLAFSLATIMKLLFADLEFATILGLSTLIMLIISPMLARSLSFLLSLLALWGLVTLHRLSDHPSRLSELFFFGASFRAGILIALFTAPLLALVFNTINPSQLVANPILVPLAGDLLLPLGFLDGILMLLFHHVPNPLRLLTEGLSHAVLGLAGGFSRLPGSEIPVPHVQPAFVILFYGLLLLMMLSPPILIRRYLTGLFFVFILALLLPARANLPLFSRAIISKGGMRATYHPERERENLKAFLP